jgi:predicted deacylase
MSLKCAWLVLGFAVSSAWALDFSRYHSQDEIAQYLRGQAQAYPSLVQFQVLGDSDEHREIAYLVVTKSTAPDAPALYFNGTHHGNEWSSTEGILGLIDYLIQHRDDAEVSGWLTRYRFFLQPLVNPDGHAASTREDVNGADPNRDYAFPELNENDAFKTHIIQVVKKLTDKVKFRAAVAYHSGIEEVLWSWCYTGNHITDYDLLYTLAKKAATAMGFDRYLQSYDDYFTQGEFIDYLYMKQRTLALTFEVSEIMTPPESELEAIVNRSIQGALAVIRSVDGYDRGTMPLEAAPLYTRWDRRNPLWVALQRKLE